MDHQNVFFLFFFCIDFYVDFLYPILAAAYELHIEVFHTKLTMVYEVRTHTKYTQILTN